MKTMMWAAVTVAGLITPLSAAAQFAKAEDAIKYRKASFTVMGAHFSRIGAMAQGKIPFDARAAQENADLVLAMSKLPFAAFPAGSDKGDTKARAEIWSQGDKFRSAASKMQEEAAKLGAAARSGKLDTIKAAFGPAADSCKACHDDFRRK